MNNFLLILSVLSALIGCTPPSTVVKTPPQKESSYPVMVEKNDTLSYIVEFPDEKKRMEFVESFENFMRNYPYAGILKSMDNKFVHIKVHPTDSMEIVLPESLTIIKQPQFTESLIESHTDSITDSLIAETDTFLPEFGGSVRLYTSRSSITSPFSLLTSGYPFSQEDTTDTILNNIVSDDSISGVKPVFEIVSPSARRVILKLRKGLKNANGRSLSALDVINAWTGFVKAHPVEGLALFRHVDGIKEFIQGNEAIIKGFGATDQETVILKMVQQDNEAVERLKTHRLLVQSLKLGVYYIEKTNDREQYLLSNPPLQGKKAFLEQMTLYTGGDDNPILSFSLNKYDAVTVFTVNDLSYAKTNLIDNASLVALPSERYFISCPVSDIEIRKYISSNINPSDILSSFVKEEGSVISRICDTVHENLQNTATELQKIPYVSKPLKILYRSDDRTSRIIAEKLLADLSADQIPSKLVGADISGYEKSIASGNCDIIVGWISQSVISDRSEQLRLAAIWFNDETDEQVRIREYREIPLFELNRYLLVRKNINLYKESITGIYIHSDDTKPQDLKLLNEN